MCLSSFVLVCASVVKISSETPDCTNVMYIRGRLPVNLSQPQLNANTHLHQSRVEGCLWDTLELQWWDYMY